MAFMDLSTELLVHILDQIPVEVYYPSTIYHVMLSCRRLSTIAMPHLYRKLTFNFPQTEERMDPDSPNPFRDYDGMLLLHPERAAWAQSASFTYSFKRPDLWDHMANILPKLSFLQTLDIGAGLGHPDPFGEFVNLAVPNPTSHRLSHDRNLMDLFDVCCGDLEFLHSVRVMDRIITIQEAWAMFALPNIRNLELRTLNEIEGPYTASNDTPPPSLLLSFSLTADMLPNAHIVQPLFERLSALKVLRWSAEHPQPSSNFHDSLERWSPKAIENAISPCKSTLSELQLYNTLVQQLIVLPHIDLHDFSVLSVLKISARILFSHALRTSYSERMRNRKDYVKRLPRNIKYLEIRFHEDESARNNHPNTAGGFNWLLEVPSCKENYCPGLRRVGIVEDLDSEFPQQRMTNSPDHLSRVFSAADIDLEIILRAAPPTRFDEINR